MEDKEETPKAEELDVRKLLEEDRRKRIAACEAEINATLGKHGCVLNTIQEFVNGQPGKMAIKVVAKD